MGIFRKAKKSEPIVYDHATEVPAVRKSICTGEMTTGFKAIDGNAFRPYALAGSSEELRAFAESCGVKESDLKVIY